MVVKIKDVRAKSDADLAKQEKELRKEALNLRFQQATGQLTKTSRRRQVRREIAKIKTVQAERVMKKKGA